MSNILLKVLVNFIIMWYNIIYDKKGDKLMYINIERQKNKQGRVYLYKVIGVYDKYTNKVKKTRELIGRVDELEKLYDNPYEHFKNILLKESKELKEQNRQRLSLTTTNILTIKDKLKDNSSLISNLGCIFITKLYHSLEFEYLFNKIKYEEKTKLPLSKILQFLINQRIMYPSSKAKDFENINNYAENFKFKLDDIYRALDIFHKYKHLFINAIKDNIAKFIKYDLSQLHYDVTNYFIYTDINENIEDNKLLKKGYSKINNNCPTIQMALLTDNNSLPIDYKLFAGNRNDVSTYVDFMKELDMTYPIRKAVVVADAGLVSNNNIVATLLGGANYIFKHSLLRFNKEEFNMFKECVKPVIEEAMINNPNANGFYKSVDVLVNRFVSDIYGNKQKVELRQRYLFMYSKKYDNRSEHIRMSELENANEYINSKKKLTNTIKKISSSLIDVEDIKVDIDKNRLEKYEETSGYSVIITSCINMSDEDIIKAYKNQYLIEESFKITKSDIKTRPIYLSNDNHIQSHFFVCFLALLFIRIIQIGLNRELSSKDIIEAMKELNLVSMSRTSDSEISTYTENMDKIAKFLGVKFNEAVLNGAQIRKLFGDAKKI